jgi:LasA protease
VPNALGTHLIACAIAIASMGTSPAHAANEKAAPLPSQTLAIDDREVRWDTRTLSLDDAIAAIDADENLKPYRDLIIDRAGRASLSPRFIRALLRTSNALEAIDRSDAESAHFTIAASISSATRLYYMGKARAQASADPASSVNTISEAERVRLNELDAHGLSAIAQTLVAGENAMERLASEYATLFGKPGRDAQEEVRRTDSIRINGIAEVAPASAPANFLRLPWLVGQKNWRFGGLHSNDGSCPSQACASPRSSIDFYHLLRGWGEDVSAGRVLSAHEGVVTVFSGCNLRVTHPSGWATNYYHLSGIRVATGQSVYAGQWLSNYANTEAQAICEGGRSGGPHVHVTLIANGNHVSLDQTEFSGWRVNATGVIQDYDSDCSRMMLSRNGFNACPHGPSKLPITPWTMHTLPVTMPSNNRCAFDIDGNGAADPNTDGLLLLRYLHGFRGNSLISGAIGAGAARSTGDAVASFIASRDYDLNVDNRTTAATDGILFHRLLRGYTGFALTRAVDTFPDYLIGGSDQIIEYATSCR